MNGSFVRRRADDSHNAVSPVFLEQTYNADSKEESGIDGISMNATTRSKWVYTKPVTTAVSSQLKSMLHQHFANPHHEYGRAHVARDLQTVQKVVAAMLTNLFTATVVSLANISTGQQAAPDVEVDLTNVKEISVKAVSESLSGNQMTTKVVKLKTIYTQNAKAMKPKVQSTGHGKSDEVADLL